MNVNNSNTPSNFEKAWLTRNLKFLLLDHYSFRLYIKFKSSEHYGHQRGGRIFYGNEHNCTYNQCLSKKIEVIKLDKLKGYTDLINLVERGSFKNKFETAKLYGKSPGSVAFDVCHRQYFNGKLKKDSVIDPEIDTTEQFTFLYYNVDEFGRVIINTQPF